ncbi:MAG: PAS domain S-box protein [Methanoregula sp.]|nr:PAS domain S-box protein [Methanoregula sp.]
MISVLYVDDEPALLEIGKTFLEMSGAMTVETSLSAADAQERLAQCSYDAIVSDYQMPLTNGIEFLKFIRSGYGVLPFILFTGRGREEVVIEALNLGADFYLQKGGSPAPQFTELEHKIKQAVHQKQSEQRINESEERYRALFENASDAILMMERDVCVDCNPMALEFLGCTREQLIGSYLRDHSPAFQPDGCESAEKSREYLHNAHLGESCIFSWRHQRGDGKLLDVEISLTRLDVKGRELVLAIMRDISEHKAVEEALRESARLMTNIINFLPDATFAINTDGRIIAWNRAMEKMTGVSEKAMIGKGDYEYSLPFYGERRPVLIDQILSPYPPVASPDGAFNVGEQNNVSEFFAPMLYNGRGAHIWFAASQLIDSQGNVIGAIESVRDITARKNRENELQASYEQIAAMEEELRNNYEQLESHERGVVESEANYRALFSAMVEGHAVNELIYNAQGVPVEYRVLQVNPAFEKIFGIPGATAVGGTSLEVFGVDEPRALARYAEVVRTGISQSLEIWYEPMKKYLAISVYSPKKGIFATVFEDITDRRQKEQELRAAYEQIAAVKEELRSNYEELEARELVLCASEKYYRQIIDTANEGIWSMDDGMKATFVNPRLTQMLGYSRQEILGKPMTDFICAEELKDHEATIQLRRAGHSSVYERKFCKKDGSPLWCLVSAAPLHDAQGRFQGSFAMHTDITASKLARQELEQKNQQLNAANEQMAAAYVALKSTGAELVVRNRELEEQRESIGRAKKALKIANRKLNLLSGITRHDVLNQLMALGGYVELSADGVQDPKFQLMIEKERKIIEMIHQQILFTQEYEDMGVNAPVWQIVGTTVANAAAGLDLSGVGLTVESGDLEVFADQLLGKVFLNLMDNTLRYGETVTEITVSFEKTESGLVIIYTDNGVGVDADARPHLFERGFGKHTGLGLFFSKEVLSITGLTIAETGTPGKGVRFEITVPDGEYRFAGIQPSSP